MNRLGRAETGVSILTLSRVSREVLRVSELELLELVEFCETGCGRANGFGGPDAPAESRAEAEGDGGGRTTLEPCSPLRRPPACEFCASGPCGEELESPVPSSDCSSGICTFRTGRLPPPPKLALFVREGGVKPSEGETKGADDIEDMETLRALTFV